ncbi:MAG: hypothetical protein NW215_10535 [Hyphomicrobiales bacterium]|nr:hypothetical protein [Hyphomicrobiales bacterium]
MKETLDFVRRIRPPQLQPPLPPGTQPALLAVMKARAALKAERESLIRIACSDAWAPARAMAESGLEFINRLDAIMKEDVR